MICAKSLDSAFCKHKRCFGVGRVLQSLQFKAIADVFPDTHPCAAPDNQNNSSAWHVWAQPGRLKLVAHWQAGF
jgi:hypothetical protein